MSDQVQVTEVESVVQVLVPAPIVVEVIEGDTVVVEVLVPGPQGPEGPGADAAPLSDAFPQPLGADSPGISAEASRDDHVHPMPTANQVGAATAAQVISLVTVAANDARDDAIATAADDATAKADAAQAAAEAASVPLTALGDTVATLVSGVIPTSQIPAIAISEFLGNVANQAAMLALVGQRGDWAIRTDTGLTWVISGNDPTQLADWTALSYPGAPVTEINGQTGVVTLDFADVGADPAGSAAAAQAAAIAAAAAGNAATATKLATARNIDGTPFDGSANVTVVGPAIFGAANKSVPADNDRLALTDSAASNILKYVTWGQIKAVLNSLLATLFAPLKWTVTTVAASGSTLTLNYGLGEYFIHTMTVDLTSLLFTNLAGANRGTTITLKIIQHATVPKTFAWPASFRWPGGVPGVLSTTAGVTDRLVLISDDNGTTWHATLTNGYA